MIDYKLFYDLLLKNKLITPIWRYILDIMGEEIKDISNKNHYLIIFSIYFSLIDDGNICISLNKNKLKNKWYEKLDSTKVLLKSNSEFEEHEYEDLYIVSEKVIEDYLDDINEEKLSNLIGENKFFNIDNNWLYTKKYSLARKGIIESINRLFLTSTSINTTFNYQDYVVDHFKLSEGQEKIIKEGINKNLIITGGPGTGKTTSILFLLLCLLSQKEKEQIIYLVAPSGKASSRMKESIINGLVNIKDDYKNSHPELIDIINNLEESTIHRLLSIDFETNTFSYNKRHQFAENSLFIIDEASMIDICLFNSLLEAIPTSARVFIMGDKNQLPSVESGAVFGELLKKASLQNNIVELDESIRFKKGTKIYELASLINNGGKLPTLENDWQDYTMFEIKEDNNEKPIYYYKNVKENVREKDIVEYVVNKWGEAYYKELQNMAMDLDCSNQEYLNELFDYTEKSKILCAENEGPKGVKKINSIIKKNCIDTKKVASLVGYYPGQLMMINKNNKMLDLYNGDSGILVTFKDDKVLYLMVKKASNIVKNDGKQDDKIFKLGSFVFYPLRLITSTEIDLAYAITIHKSQGSDYKNILVILPTSQGHPLLNRQIIYTAITRTKGNTYILSSQERLEEAKDRLIQRDTNIA